MEEHSKSEWYLAQFSGLAALSLSSSIWPFLLEQIVQVYQNFGSFLIWAGSYCLNFVIFFYWQTMDTKIFFLKKLDHTIFFQTFYFELCPCLCQWRVCVHDCNACAGQKWASDPMDLNYKCFWVTRGFWELNLGSLQSNVWSLALRQLFSS